MGRSKRSDNLIKHGVDFASLSPLFDGLTVSIFDDRFDYGEDRFITFGLLNGIVLAVVTPKPKMSFA